MKPQDEEIQRRVEAGELTERSADAEAYRKVFSALSRDKGFELPPYFTDRVLRQISVEKAKKESFRDSLWFIIGGVSFLVALVVSFYVIDFKPDFHFGLGVFKFISGYAGLFTFGVIFILLLNYIDRKFIRMRMN